MGFINSDLALSGLGNDGDSCYVAFTNIDGAGADYIWLQFQYPPRVTSDSRKINWKTVDNVPGSNEPITQYSSSGPREITLAFSYINNKLPWAGGGIWDHARISANLRLLRGYFHRVTIVTNKSQRDLAIWVKLWAIGGQKKWMTFRMVNLDIKYSETMIIEANNVRINDAPSILGLNPVTIPQLPRARTKTAFPFKTDVTMTIAHWTRGFALDGDDNPIRNTGINDLRFLEEGLTREWY
jgi:hypothetical protein